MSSTPCRNYARVAGGIIPPAISHVDSSCSASGFECVEAFASPIPPVAILVSVVHACLDAFGDKKYWEPSNKTDNSLVQTDPTNKVPNIFKP